MHITYSGSMKTLLGVSKDFLPGVRKMSFQEIHIDLYDGSIKPIQGVI